MSLYYITETITKGQDAGNKARNDVERILSDKITAKKLYLYDDNKSKLHIALNVFVNIILKTKRNDMIIIQYAMKTGYNWVIPIISRFRNIGIVIHDIHTLRTMSPSKKELKALRNVKFIVSHNEKMTQYLRENGCKCSIKELGIFDYLVNTTEIPQTHCNDEVLCCYAGNLKKSPFIYKISKEIIKRGFNVYGAFFQSDMGHELCYKGRFDSEIIHEELVGRYGLVWDGDECTTCSGSLGNYMRYNNPHKASMYIAAGIPIVVWSESALKDFVIRNNIGIAVSSIDELIEFDENITKEKYEELYQNVLKVREKITKGEFLTSAII